MESHQKITLFAFLNDTLSLTKVPAYLRIILALTTIRRNSSHVFSEASVVVLLHHLYAGLEILTSGLDRYIPFGALDTA